MIYYSPHRKAHRRWRLPPRLCRTTVAIQILLLLTVTLVVCGLLEMSNMGTALLSGSSSDQKPVGGHSDPDTSPPKADEHVQDEADEPQGNKKYRYTYTTMPGYFLQDDPSTNPAKFDFLSTNFGLIEREYDSDASLPDQGRDMTVWQRFEHHINTLNEETKKNRRHESETDTRYVLFMIGRHGNGYHNIAESYYGSEAWNCHFSALDGDPDEVMTWSDAHLSQAGKRQAHEVNAFWKKQISNDGQKMSLPEVYLVSPLDRTLETLKISFDGLIPSGVQDDGKGNVIVVERLREGAGIHTCDRRSNVQYIHGHYPAYNVDLDPNLSEVDTFWDANRREPDSALTKRLRTMFDDLMSDPKVLGREVERVSITSHSGSIGAMQRALGHRDFALKTGAVIPIFVKVQSTGLDNDKTKRSTPNSLHKRNGGSGEGKSGKDPILDLPDLNEDGETSDQPASGSDSADRSKWQTIPACPAGMDLDTVGRDRWGMSLKEFLDGVEDGTLHPE